MRASAAQAWISSVDLPMPGSPPISATEPGDKAAAGDAIEFGDAGDDARLGRGRARQPLERERRARRCGSREAAMPAATASSTIVFHSPQELHLPCQRCVIAPQFWQTNRVFDLAMKDGGRIWGRVSRRAEGTYWRWLGPAA